MRILVVEDEYKIAEAHGGEVCVLDNPGGGALFRVLFATGQEH